MSIELFALVQSVYWLLRFLWKKKYCVQWCRKFDRGVSFQNSEQNPLIFPCIFFLLLLFVSTSSFRYAITQPHRHRIRSILKCELHEFEHSKQHKIDTLTWHRIRIYAPHILDEYETMLRCCDETRDSIKQRQQILVPFFLVWHLSNNRAQMKILFQICNGFSKIVFFPNVFRPILSYSFWLCALLLSSPWPFSSYFCVCLRIEIANLCFVQGILFSLSTFSIVQFIRA